MPTKKVATLTTRQKMVLMTYVEQAFFNPETAATMVVNPRPSLLSSGLTEEDVENIAEFLDLITGLKRGGGTGSAMSALKVKPQEDKDPDPDMTEASLSDDQIIKLVGVLDKALVTTETLQHLFDNAISELTAAGLSEQDIADIAHYMKVAKNVIELNRDADW